MPYYAQRSHKDGKSRNDSSSRTFTGSQNKRKYHFKNYIHALNDHKLPKQYGFKKSSVKIATELSVKPTVVK